MKTFEEYVAQEGLRESLIDTQEAVDLILELMHMAWDEARLSAWIPVSERLPEGSADVLVISNDGNCAVWAGPLIRSIYKDMAKDEGSFFTHWMPLPEPPKG
jgi:hypothetical protein